MLCVGTTGHHMLPIPNSHFPFCSKEDLKEKLDAFQCHFTWHLSIEGHIDISHVMQKLAVEIKYTPHQNQAALLGLQAYLYQLKDQNREAPQSLKDAEEC